MVDPAEGTNIPDKLYFKIGEVSDITGVQPYILRYWETEFPAINPTKRRSRHRLYRKKDIEEIMRIKHLLYEEKFTIAGARAQLKDMHKKIANPDATATLSVDDPGEGTLTEAESNALVSELKAIRELLA